MDVFTMEKFKEFVKATLLGGIGIILPILIIILVFTGLFNYIADKVQPITTLISNDPYIKGNVADNTSGFALKVRMSNGDYQKVRTTPVK